MSTTARLFGFSSRGRLIVSLACVLQGLCGLHLKTVAAERACQAAQVRTRLTESIMPYWYDTSVDRTNGGFILADDGTGKSKSATQKMIVTQARMVWSFSHAHIMGLGSGQRDYLGAAAQGRSFISKRFFDRKNGGYFWTTDLKGEPVNRSKLSYGQAFVIYGFVEYYRASKDREALDDAMAVYDLLQRHAHDPEYRGWGEHFTQEWTPTLSPGDDAVVELPGCKSANTHLHLMEAFTELYEATGDVRVKRSLLPSLHEQTNPASAR